MVLIRAAVQRVPSVVRFSSSALRSPLRAALPPSRWSRLGQQLSRRTYASGSEHGKKSSDIPWLLGSVAIGVPATLYILSMDYGGGHDDHDGHGEGHEEKDEEADSSDDEAPKDESEDKSGEEKDTDDGENEESSGDNKNGDNAKEDESEKNSKEDKPKDDNSKDESGSEDDSKEEGKDGADGDGKKGEKAAKSAKNDGIHDKQTGLSNTQTRPPPVSFEGKSTKGEGAPDTAKADGPVSTDRKQK